MDHPLLGVNRISQEPDVYLRATGCIFARFDDRTQDSGNISYGVRVEHQRYFVKTAGHSADPTPYLTHDERIALLRNAVFLANDCHHAVLPRLRNVIESPDGPLLVYDWADGELARSDKLARDDPNSTFQRFRRLPVTQIVRALDMIYELHEELAASSWIAVDFYDGCLIYDFHREALHIVDLDTYRQGPFTNEMGRMFGSSRFMAPEEYELGATIDQRTTVFTMGRTAAVLLSDGTLARSSFRAGDLLYTVICRACREDPDERYGSVSEFHAAWRQARTET